MRAAEWIDRAKAVKGWESDYRAAKELGITRGAMSQIRTGDSATLGEETVLRVAQALEVDPAIVLADQAMERAKSAGARSAWATVLERLGGVAAGLLVVVGVNPALLNDVAALCALCKPEDAPAAAPARRRPAARGALADMARTLSHTPARA
jgi:hypothetical protein